MDDVLILISDQCHQHKNEAPRSKLQGIKAKANKSHSAKPIIPTFQYSSLPWLSITAIRPSELTWPEDQVSML